MSTELNAEELAAKRYAGDSWFTSEQEEMTRLSEQVYAAAIREVAQPIADERDELREALEAIIKQWHTPNWKLVESTGSIINKAEYVLAKYPKKP